jgi:hypothetical protein
MADHYAQWMEGHVPNGRVIADRFEVRNELFFIMRNEE